MSNQEKASQVPGQQRVKAPLKLAPSQPALRAAQEILEREWAVILTNEPTGRGGWDPEVLHDFRVSVRRTRSCFVHFKKALGVEVVTSFRPEFKWLGSVTGPARDLDVLLEALDTRRRELARGTLSDLDELRAYLHHRQAMLRDELESELASARWAVLRARWSRYLEDPSRYPSGPDAEREAREFVGDRLWIRFRRIANARSVTEPGTSIAQLHALRIECKKLRYLLEFARSFYTPSDMTALISLLKQLQNVLGAINDDDTQERALETHASHLLAESPRSVRTVMAIGAVRETLRRDLDQQRQLFARRFTRFVNEGEVRFRRVVGR